MSGSKDIKLHEYKKGDGLNDHRLFYLAKHDCRFIHGSSSVVLFAALQGQTILGLPPLTE